MPRDLARKVKNLQHGGAFAHDAVKLKVLEQLLFERAHPPALILERRDFVQRALEAVAIDRFGQEVGGPASDGFERGVQRVLSGHHENVQARVGPECAVEKFVPVDSGIGQQHAAASVAHTPQSFFGIRGHDGLVPELLHHRRQRLELRRIIVKNAGSQRARGRDDFRGFGVGVGHVRGIRKQRGCHGGRAH